MCKFLSKSLKDNKVISKRKFKKWLTWSGKRIYVQMKYISNCLTNVHHMIAISIVFERVNFSMEFYRECMDFQDVQISFSQYPVTPKFHRSVHFCFPLIRSEIHKNQVNQFSSEKLLLHKVHKAESILAPNWHKTRKRTTQHPTQRRNWCLPAFPWHSYWQTHSYWDTLWPFTHYTYHE